MHILAYNKQAYKRNRNIPCNVLDVKDWNTKIMERAHIRMHNTRLIKIARYKILLQKEEHVVRVKDSVTVSKLDYCPTPGYS